MKIPADRSLALWEVRLAIIGRSSTVVLVARVHAVFLGAPVRHTLIMPFVVLTYFSI